MYMLLDKNNQKKLLNFEWKNLWALKVLCELELFSVQKSGENIEYL